MAVFTQAEIDYLKSQKLGRLATVGSDGMPHLSPVTFRYNPETDTIDVGGLRNAQTKKFRDVKQNPKVAFIVDDVVPPWKPRGIEIRGQATALAEGGKQISDRFDGSCIRIRPSRIVGFGLEETDGWTNSRSIAS